MGHSLHHFVVPLPLGGRQESFRLLWWVNRNNCEPRVRQSPGRMLQICTQYQEIPTVAALPRNDIVIEHGSSGPHWQSSKLVGVGMPHALQKRQSGSRHCRKKESPGQPPQPDHTCFTRLSTGSMWDSLAPGTAEKKKALDSLRSRTTRVLLVFRNAASATAWLPALPGNAKIRSRSDCGSMQKRRGKMKKK